MEGFVEDQRLKEEEEMIEESSDDCTSEDEGIDDYRREVIMPFV